MGEKRERKCKDCGELQILDDAGRCHDCDAGMRLTPEKDAVTDVPCNVGLSDTLEEKTTDELLELLPSNLHLARNENAPDHDKWRIYNSATKKYIEPGKATARELMLYTAVRMGKITREWTGR